MASFFLFNLCFLYSNSNCTWQLERTKQKVPQWDQQLVAHYLLLNQLLAQEAALRYCALTPSYARANSLNNFVLFATISHCHAPFCHVAIHASARFVSVSIQTIADRRNNVNVCLYFNTMLNSSPQRKPMASF